MTAAQETQPIRSLGTLGITWAPGYLRAGWRLGL